MGQRVRSFTPGDAQACCTIAQANWREVLSKVYPKHVVERYAANYVPDQFASHADRPDAQVLVAEGTRGIAGFLWLFIPPGAPRAEIWRMFVDPAQQGKGHGKALLRTAQDYLRARGVEVLYVESAILPATLQFYEGQGFVAVDEGLQGDAIVVKLEKTLL